MAKRMSLYQTGRKPQYRDAERWKRYEDLRVSGFTKKEARELSKVHSPQGLEVVNDMRKSREYLLSRFTTSARENEWTGRSAYMRFVYRVRDFYSRNGFTRKQALKGGELVWHWYHGVENKKARKRGWVKGAKPGGVPDWLRKERGEEELPPSRRPPKMKSPPRKGNVSAQRDRAKARAGAFREAVKAGNTPSERKEKREWIENLRSTVKREPWRDATLTEQARRLGFTGDSLLRTRGARLK